jgi:hypothetical protein
MKKVLITLLGVLCLLPVTHAQTFIFPPVTTPGGCTPADNYTLHCTFTVQKITIPQIYSDNGVTGSFAFEVSINISNVFVGTVASTGNFYNYSPTLYSTLPEVPASITNTSNIIPIANYTASNIPTSTNPTFNGSASALGFVVGGVYTDPDTLALFGYDSASLVIDLPCIGSQNLDPDVVSLPVLFSGLKGIVTPQGIVLNWATYSETNNRGFYIERSADARHWQEIGWLAAAPGDKMATTSYSFADPAPAPGKNLYRIVQTDHDGRQSYSNTVPLVWGKENETGVTVYPNPATDVLTLQQANGQPFHYRLCSLMGTVVAAGQCSGQVQLPVRHLAAGTYVLQADGHTYPVMLYR